MTVAAVILSAVLSGAGSGTQEQTQPALSVELQHVVSYTDKILDSRYGEITRLQSILRELCESPGLVKAVQPVRERAEGEFFARHPQADRSKDALIWMSSVAGQSYAAGIKTIANIAQKAEGDDLMREGVCKGYKRAAETYLNAEARAHPL